MTQKVNKADVLALVERCDAFLQLYAAELETYLQKKNTAEDTLTRTAEDALTRAVVYGKFCENLHAVIRPILQDADKMGVISLKSSYDLKTVADETGEINAGSRRLGYGHVEDVYLKTDNGPIIDCRWSLGGIFTDMARQASNNASRVLNTDPDDPHRRAQQLASNFYTRNTWQPLVLEA